MRKRSPILLILALAILGVGIGVRLLSRDATPIDTSDLAVADMKIAAGQNAFPLLVEAADALVLSHGQQAEVFRDYARGGLTNTAAIGPLLQTNAQAFALVEHALQRPDYASPTVTNLSTDISYVQNLLNIGYALSARARWSRTRQDDDTALTSIRLELEMGRRVTAQPQTLVEYLVGQAILKLALRDIRDSAYAADTPDSELVALAEILDQDFDLADGISRAIRCEFRGSTQAVHDIRKGTGTGGLPGMGQLPAIFQRRLPRLLYREDETLLLFADYYRGLIANADRDFSSIDWTFQTRIEEVLSARGSLRSFLHPNLVGRMLASMFVPALDRMLEHRCRMDAELSATRVIVAAQRYHRTTGQFPKDLETLVPKYLPSVPSDPFDGEPLRYDPSSRRIYSVGANLEDHSGSTELESESTWRRGSETRWYRQDGVWGLNGPLDFESE